MKSFANITVIGRDKTGVIARVTSFLFEHHANIEALEEQVTRGRFSMHLLASWPREFQSIDQVRSGLRELGRALGMEIGFRAVNPERRQRFGILVTRESHCLEAILAACRARKLNADPAVIVGNRGDLEPLARKAGLPFHHVAWSQRDKAESKALGILRRYEADFVVLARFMKILSPNFVWRYKNKIINIHPSLLPSFPGAQAYRQAYEAGVKIVGVTAHFVTMHLDEGPIIAQGAFSVRRNMKLTDLILAGQKLEAGVLVKAVRLYLTRNLDVFWGKVHED